MLKLLLFVALHRHWIHVDAARRFQHGVAVIAVGLVATTIGPHVARGQELDLMP